MADTKTPAKMTTRTKVILAVVILAIIAALIYFLTRKKKEAATATGAATIPTQTAEATLEAVKSTAAQINLAVPQVGNPATTPYPNTSGSISTAGSIPVTPTVPAPVIIVPSGGMSSAVTPPPPSPPIVVTPPPPSPVTPTPPIVVTTTPPPIYTGPFIPWTGLSVTSGVGRFSALPAPWNSLNAQSSNIASNFPTTVTSGVDGITRPVIYYAVGRDLSSLTSTNPLRVSAHSIMGTDGRPITDYKTPAEVISSVLGMNSFAKFIVDNNGNLIWGTIN